MATARMAAGNVLGVVTDVANTISVTSNTIANGVGILNDMVVNLKTKRQESNMVEMISFRTNLMSDAALDAVKREENIRAYIGQDTVKQDSYNNFHKKLTDAFEKFDKGE
jgi:hypothetical protein